MQYGAETLVPHLTKLTKTPVAIEWIHNGLGVRTVKQWHLLETLVLDSRDEQHPLVKEFRTKKGRTIWNFDGLRVQFDERGGELHVQIFRCSYVLIFVRTTLVYAMIVGGIVLGDGTAIYVLGLLAALSYGVFGVAPALRAVRDPEKSIIRHLRFCESVPYGKLAAVAIVGFAMVILFFMLPVLVGDESKEGQVFLEAFVTTLGPFLGVVVAVVVIGIFIIRRVKSIE